jgi:hypothetical protein
MPYPLLGAAGLERNGFFVYKRGESNFCFVEFLFLQRTMSRGKSYMEMDLK